MWFGGNKCVNSIGIGSLIYDSVILCQSILGGCDY